MNKRIGIVTWLGDGNYGTSLQAYALYHYLTTEGYDCEVINYFNYKHFSLKGQIKFLFRVLGLLNLYKRNIINKRKDKIKALKLRDFINKNIKQAKIETPWQYKRLLLNTDVFCVGSDQVWNAYYKFTPFNFLDFAGNVKRISYASSMGTNDFPKADKDDIKELLLKFAHISLREKTGRDAVARLTGREDIKTVLDPTFLLDADKWKSVCKEAKIEIDIPKKYILVYLIGNNPGYEQQIQDLKAKTGIENIVVIPAVENADFEIKGAVVYRYAAVSEFVSLLSNASWICTDSFHATALSINLNKNFTEFLRFKNSDKGSQNSRIYDILSTFDLDNRLYDKEKDAWAKEIDFTHTTEILNALRKDSSEWLINAIEN